MNAKIQGRSAPFGGEKKRGGGQLQTKRIILLDTWHSLYRKLFRRLWITIVDNFELRMFFLFFWGGGGGRLSMTFKNRGQ